ncbi:MAG: APC family permease [Clostridia bacterium]
MKNKLNLLNAVSTGVGMIIATSCFISLSDGASALGTAFIIPIVIVCLVNMFAASSIAETNAVMPNLTGGMAQYSLVGVGPLVTTITMVGGYVISNIFAAPAEGAMFGLVMHDLLGSGIPVEVYSIGLTVILIIINLMGVNISAKVQTIIAIFMVSSLLIIGIIGAFQLTPAEVVVQDSVLSTDFSEIMSMSAIAFWLFIGSEFIVPLGKDMKNPQKDVPRSMFLALGIMCVIQVLMVIGFSHYTDWTELGNASSPHVLYVVNMLGEFGRYWIILVAIFAAVSTQNSIIGSVSEIACGMSKTGLLPAFLQKKNKRNAPYPAILILGGLTIAIEASGISTGEAVAFLILVSSLFNMLVYITAHFNVIVFRKRFAKTPRTYKSKFFPLPQIIGIAFTFFMMYNISTDTAQRMSIFALFGVLTVALAIYAFVWIKFKLKIPLLKGFAIDQVMAMENPLYNYLRSDKSQTDKEEEYKKNVDINR